MFWAQCLTCISKKLSCLVDKLKWKVNISCIMKTKENGMSALEIPFSFYFSNCSFVRSKMFNHSWKVVYFLIYLSYLETLRVSMCEVFIQEMDFWHMGERKSEMFSSQYEHILGKYPEMRRKHTGLCLSSSHRQTRKAPAWF